MTTLITRWWWIVVTLVALFGVVFLIGYTHTANVVQSAANASRQIAAITSDTSELQKVVTQNLQASLPLTEHGQTLFNPATDIVTTTQNLNQNVQVSVTYHMPVLGPIQALFGVGPTVSITRTSTQVLDYVHNGLHATLSNIPASLIGVNQVGLTNSGTQLNLVVTGYGFGAAPAGVPGTTTGSSFLFQDLTQGWQAGSPISGLSITYGSWSDNQITVTGIENLGKGTEVIQMGDNVKITVSSSNGTATYNFVANPSGTAQYSVSLTASATSVSTQSPVTLTASSSVPGDGTNGIGLYDTSTGAYLAWSAQGTTVSQLVNQGLPQTQGYIAYYGPQGQMASALATSKNVGVTWLKGQGTIEAIMTENASGTWTMDLYGLNVTGATVTGTGLSGQVQVSPNEISVQAASAADTSGEVTWANGTQMGFTAIPY